jgi:hypothetical protein
LPGAFPRRGTLFAVRAALEAAGVAFIPENGGAALGHPVSRVWKGCWQRAERD